MEIGGFVKQSLIDYPGKMAAVVFTRGCNFRCGYCHNPGLVLPSLFAGNPPTDPEFVWRYLKSRRMWLDGVVVTGGEPTLHRDLPDFLGNLKQSGFLVKLDTNGSHPEMLSLILREGLADYVAMDIKTVPEDAFYRPFIGSGEVSVVVRNILSSVELLKNSGVQRQFRTTCLPGIHDPEKIERIRQYLGEDESYLVQEFRPGENVGSYPNTDLSIL